MTLGGVHRERGHSGDAAAITHELPYAICDLGQCRHAGLVASASTARHDEVGTISLETDLSGRKAGSGDDRTA